MCKPKFTQITPHLHVFISKGQDLYLVMKKNGEYISQKYNPAGGIGPEGWRKAIKKEIKIS